MQETGTIFVKPDVYSSKNGGLSSESLADIAIRKIIYVDKASVPPELYDQAMAYRDKIHKTILSAIKSARRSALSDCIYEAETLGLLDLSHSLRRRIDNGDY